MSTTATDPRGSTSRAPSVARNSRRLSALHAVAPTGSGAPVATEPLVAMLFGTSGSVTRRTTRRLSRSTIAVEYIVVTAASRPSGLVVAVSFGQPSGGRSLARTLPTAWRVRWSMNIP